MSQELPDGVELPPLPKLLISENATLTIGPFTDDQMHAYATAAILADREKQAARVPVIERYAQAAHWYINAHDQELLEHGDNRRAAISQVHAIEGELVAMGFEFAAPTEPSKPEQAEAPGWDKATVSRVFSTLRYLLGVKTGEGSPAEQLQSIIDTMASWAAAGPRSNQAEAMKQAAAVRALATQPPASNAGERELPPLPERERRFLCTKCGATTCKRGQERQTNPECSDCGYLGFAEDADFTAEQMQDYARAALATKPQAGDVAQDSVTLKQRMDELIEQHGSLRAVGRVLEFDPGYLSRLASGEKSDPGEALLRRMGLREVTSYVRAASKGEG